MDDPPKIAHKWRTLFEAGLGPPQDCFVVKEGKNLAPMK
jgi:hypothetical protein